MRRKGISLLITTKTPLIRGRSWAGVIEYAGSLAWGDRAGNSGGSTWKATSHLAQDLRLGIKEGNRWTGNQLVDGTISWVVHQRLGVGGDPKGNGAVDTIGNDTLREREGDGERQSTNQHLTGETLHRKKDNIHQKRFLDITDSTYIGGSVDSGRAEGQKGTNPNRSSVRNGQRRVRRDTKVTTRNKRSSQCQNFIRSKSEIERLWNGSSGIKNVQDRLVTSFDGQNRTSGSEEDRIGKEVGGSKVRGDADVFYETSNAGHCRDVGQNFREVERASIDGHAPKGLDTLLRNRNIRVR